MWGSCSRWLRRAPVVLLWFSRLCLWATSGLVVTNLTKIRADEHVFVLAGKLVCTATLMQVGCMFLLCLTHTHTHHDKERGIPCEQYSYCPVLYIFETLRDQVLASLPGGATSACIPSHTAWTSSGKPLRDCVVVTALNRVASHRNNLRF